MKRWAWAVRSAGLLVAYVALARGSLELASIHISSSPFWPPAGLAIAALALWGMRYAPVILLGAFLSNLWISGHAPSSALIAVGNTGEAMLGGWLVQRAGGVAALDRLQGVGGFAVAAGAGAAVSAGVGVGSLVLFDLAPASAAASIGVTWFLGNVGGTMIVAPLMLTFARRRPDTLDLLGFVLGLGAGVAAFLGTGAVILLLLPAVFWALLRPHGPVATTLLGVALGSTGATLAGVGPFWGRDANEALLLLQIFLAVAAFPVWVLAAGRGTRSSQPHMAANLGGIALALAPLFAAAALVGASIHPTLVDLDNRRQADQEHIVINAWEDLIHEQGDELEVLRAYFESSDDVTEAGFQAFVAGTGWQFGPGGATAVGYAPLVAPEDKAALEATVRNDTDLPAVVADNFSVFPPAESDLHAPVLHVHPLDPSPGAIGFDLFLEPARRAAMEEAMRINAPVASPPLEIVQPEGASIGFMISLPVRQNGTVVGFVVSAQTMADGETAPQVDSSTQYRLVDTTDGESILYGDPNGTWDRSTTLQAWERTWRIDFATDSLATNPERSAPWFVLLTGGALSVAIGVVVYAYDTTRDRAVRLSETMVDQARNHEKRRSEIERLEALDRFRRRFLNMVAHELRTPLTPIRAQAFVLGQRITDDVGKKGLAILNRGINRLGSVVDDLLVAAKAEAGELSIQKAPTDLATIAARSVDAHQEAAAQNGTRLELDATPAPVQADDQRMAQVLDNLLTNALKFAPGGTIQVSTGLEGDRAVLRVRDNGTGIAPESLETLGRPFSQVDGPAQHQGTGLGLYICTTLARLHGGRLEIQSEGLGRGTTVSVILPRNGDHD